MQASSDALQWLDPVSLDLYEGNSTEPGNTGCPRWPAGAWLRSSLGELVPGRCRGTNLCEYCRRLAAVENAELLALDELYGTPPTWWAVLTTSSTNRSQATYRSAWEHARRDVGDWEYARLLEFTTGYGPRSGGQRRPHWNVLGKGTMEQGERLVASWCRRMGSSPDGQHLGTVEELGGLLGYLVLHFQKESQAPPAGWKGQRLTLSAGYLWTGPGRTTEAREIARESQARKRAMYRAEQRGLTGTDVVAAADAERERDVAVTWEYVRLTRRGTREEAERTRALLRGRVRELRGADGATVRERVVHNERWQAVRALLEARKGRARPPTATRCTQPDEPARRERRAAAAHGPPALALRIPDDGRPRGGGLR